MLASTNNKQVALQSIRPSSLRSSVIATVVWWIVRGTVNQFGNVVRCLCCFETQGYSLHGRFPPHPRVAHAFHRHDDETSGWMAFASGMACYCHFCCMAVSGGVGDGGFRYCYRCFDSCGHLPEIISLCVCMRACMCMCACLCERVCMFGCFPNPIIQNGALCYIVLVSGGAQFVVLFAAWMYTVNDSDQVKKLKR